MTLFYGVIAACGMLAAMAALGGGDYASAGAMGGFMLFALWRMERTGRP